MGRKRTPGLIKRNDIWHIDKVIKGQRIRESTEEKDLEAAERYLQKRSEEIRIRQSVGERPDITFDQAVQRYLSEAKKKSIGDDLIHLKKLKPFIGQLHLDQINMGTLAPFIESEKARVIIPWNQKKGSKKVAKEPRRVKARTINHALQVVRRILNLASGHWFHQNGLTWLQAVPKIVFLEENDKRKPKPLTWDEQKILFQECPEHLQHMALFKVNTGTREHDVCSLKWEWEHKIKLPNFEASVFIVPGKEVKNKMDRIILLNDVARDIIDKCRGKHPKFVFTYKGRPVKKMNSKAWRRARKEVGLPQVRVHDLKHTFGHRLRLAGCKEEDRADLLNHKGKKSMTRSYSAPDLTKLMEYCQKVLETERTPSVIVLGHAQTA